MSRSSGQGSAKNHHQSEVASVGNVDCEFVGGPMQCHCGLVAPIWEAWKEGTPNPGRRFMECSRFKEKKLYCGFFKWFDPPFTDRSKDIIIKLKEKLGRNNNKVESLKDKIKRMEHGEVHEENLEKQSNQEEIFMLKMEVSKLKKKMHKSV